MLLQVLDDGRLTDGQGRTVDFRNAILIMTSNVGSEVIFAESDPERMRQRVEDVLRGTFRPEFLNRIDETVIFHRLGRAELAAVVDLQLERLRVRLAGRGLGLVVSEAARELIAEEGNDPAFGARPLKRAIQRLIENPLAKLLLEHPPTGDAAVRVDAVDGAIELRVEPAVALGSLTERASGARPRLRGPHIWGQAPNVRSPSGVCQTARLGPGPKCAVPYGAWLARGPGTRQWRP